MTVPDAPQNVVAEPRNKAINLVWAEPESNGGSELTSYRVAWDPKSAEGASSATVFPSSTGYLITGLTNGEEYTITLAAWNNRGESMPVQVSSTPATVPDAPQNMMAEPGNMEISLTWDEPKSDGGSDLATYRLSWTPPNSNDVSEVNPGSGLPSSATSYTITGLTNGQKYTITLSAWNNRGESMQVQVSSTPVTVPDAPQNVMAEPGNMEISLTWDEPKSDGGSDLTTYKLSWKPSLAGGASSATVKAPLTRYRITGLTNGEEYTITLSAWNRLGEGPSTKASAIPTVTVPDAPQNVVAEPRNKAINLVWAEPESNGGSDLTTYKLSWKPSLAGGASSATVKAPLTRYRITSLTNGEEYTITLSAWNTLGEGPSTRLLATPATVPDAPQNVVADPRNMEVSLTWDEPKSDGGSDLATYRLSWTPPNSNDVSEVNPGSGLPSSATSYTITGLTNGQKYTIRLSAWNNRGESMPVQVSSTPATVPDAPQNVVAEPRNKAINLVWAEPESNGGSELTSYRVAWDPKSAEGASSATVFPSSTGYLITGLTNGEEYTITLAAWNNRGESMPVQVSSTPATVPDAPQNVVAEPRNKAINLIWAAPESDGGSDLTSYRVAWEPKPAEGASSATVFLPSTRYPITGLTNGEEYTITLSAWNRFGEGPSTKLSATPATVPDAPQNVMAEPRNMRISLTWDEPKSDGGSDLATYRLSWTPPNSNDVSEVNPGSGLPSSATSYTITGLTNGQKYTIRLSAWNNRGESMPVQVSSTPVTVPDAPQNVMAEPGNMEIRLTWDEPKSDGGSDLTTYKLSWKPSLAGGASSATVKAPLTRYRITGLTNGEEYTITLSAWNRLGEGPSTKASAIPTVTVPDAPQNVVAEPRNKAINLVWAEPESNGGSELTSYRVAWDPKSAEGASSATVFPSSTGYLITGLTNGEEYTITLAAWNNRGESMPVQVSSTPATVPDAPQNVMAEPGNMEISLTWDEPKSDGGSDLATYRLSWTPPNSNDVSEVNPGSGLPSSATSYTITGLTNGQKYTITLSAWNNRGESMPVQVSSTPATVPDAPQNVMAEPGNMEISLTWDEPKSDGGSELTSYRLSWDPTNSNDVSEVNPGSGLPSSATSYTITDLMNGVEYTITLAAWNNRGESMPVQVSSTPATVPDAPQNVVAEPRNKAINLVWAEPESNGGFALTTYKLSWKPSLAGGASSATVKAPLTRYRITSLTNGEEYTITLSAWNTLGEGPSTKLSATPATVPDAPQNVVADPRNMEVSLTWDEPKSDGGSDLATYRLSWTPPNSNDVSEVNPGSGLPSSATSYTITGLTNGQKYTIRLSAWNNRGESMPVQVSSTPVTVPDAPQNVMAEPGNMEISLTWDEPKSDGGSDLTTYKLSWKPSLAGGASSATVKAPLTRYRITGLTNGEEYTITLSAWNRLGEGPSTKASAIPTVTVPDAPQNVVAEPRNKAINLVWAEPANGGSDLTTYKLSWKPSLAGGASSATVKAPLTRYRITNLTNGEEYTITLSAWNTLGEGPSTRLLATPATVPDAPQNVVADPRNMEVSLTWDEPKSDGGSDLATYRLSWTPPNSNDVSEVNPGSGLPSSATSYTITGLTNGQKYTIRLSAWNNRGESMPVQVSAMPATVPDAPQNVMAEPRNKAINLVWAEPESNGGSELTSYRVAWDPKSAEGASSATVFPSSTGYLITGLTNGEEYTITLSAWNNRGESMPVQVSSTPATVPDAPQNVVAEPRNKAINLIWAAPESDGGSDLTSYRVAWEPKPAEGASSATVFLPSTRYPITGLTNGEEYTITLSAWNRFGEGPSTKLSATPATVPDAPQNVMAEPRNMGISLTWDEPKSDGGSDLATYRLSWTPPNSNDVSEVNPGSGLPSSATSYTITGLTNGQKYTIRLSAWNNRGESMPVQVSSTPVTVPDAPQNVMAEPGNMEISLTWDEPKSDGGSDLTTYKLSWKPSLAGGASSATVKAPLTRYRITGLTNGEEYTITLSAWNRLGEGPSTKASAIPTVTVPDAPQNVVAEPRNKAINLVWAEPESNGGSELTSYRVAWDPKSAEGASSATVFPSSTGYLITGLTNGEEYTITLAAWNNRGESMPVQVSSTPATVPDAPQNVMAEPGNMEISLTWDEPKSDGGSDLATYRLSWTPPNSNDVSEVNPGSGLPSSATSYTITDLMNGVEYTITLSAWNNRGESMPVQVSSTPVTVPDAPQNVMAEPGNMAISLTWDEPKSDGGSDLATYRLSWTPPNSNDVSEVNPGSGLPSSATSYTITDLMNGVEYTITLLAENAIGEGPSTQVLATPVGPPSTPLNVMAKPRNKAINLIWAEPESNGGSDLTTYKLSWKPSLAGGASSATVKAPLTRYRITSLTNGEEYTITLSAWNRFGEGPSTRLLATPATVPDAPQNVVADPRNMEVSLTWDEPKSDGGSDLATYRLSWTPPNSNDVSEVNPGSGLPSAATSYTITGLTNGQKYTIRLSAWNNRGESMPVQVSSTPVTVPDAPQNVVAEPRNKAINLVWAEPESNGGSELTSYRVAWDPKSAEGASSATVFPSSTGYLITGLTNGEEYTITLAAWNNRGESMPVQVSSTPATVPDAPQNVVAEPRNKAINLIWAAPESDGGSDLTSYRVAWEPKPAEGASSATVFLPSTRYPITGLTNGEEYTITLSAWNRFGEGPSTRLLATPATVPDAPQNVVADPRNMEVSLTWDEPKSDGGSDLATYRLSWTPPNSNDVSEVNPGSGLSPSATSYTITGLTNGQKYTITLSAWNNRGESMPVQVSSTPVTVPDAPQNVMAEPGNMEISLTWEAPANGGSDLTTYKLSWKPSLAGGASSATVKAPLTRYRITGLTNGEEYTITLSAWNNRGESMPVQVSSTPATVPDAPQNVVAEPRNKAINLVWAEPESNGGSKLTSYRVAWDPKSAEGASSATVLPSSTRYPITGLTNGEEYTITLSAWNNRGESMPVQVSSTPATVPDAPQNVVAEPRNKAINLVWAAPEADGGSDLTSYRVAWEPRPAEGVSSATVFPPSTRYPITGLTNGEEYTITLSAWNRFGEGPSTKLSATPATVPDAPQNVMAEPRNMEISLTWNEPESDGGSELTSYRVAWDPKSAEGASSATVFPSSTGYLITGLTNGEEYTITLAAGNALGEGPSTQVLATPVGPPTTPRNVMAKPGNMEIGLTWDRPASNGGLALTTYKLSWTLSSEEGVSETTLMAQSSDYTIIDLVNDQAYTITLSAWNDLGEGPSTKLTVTIPVGPPTRPLNVMAKPRNMAIDLTWDKPASDGGSDVTSYRLSWDPPNSKGVRKAAPQSGLSAEVTSYTITDLMHNRTYTITLLAMNRLGKGESIEISATPATVPSTPQNVVAKPMNMAIGLTWEKPASDGGSALTTYKLSWGLSSGGPIILATVSATTTQHTITDLAKVTAYTITLLAENAIGVGPSTQVLATPKGPPSTPLNVMAKPGDMKIGLTWDRPTEEENPDKVSGYQLLWAPTHEGFRGLPDSAGMVDLPVTPTVHTITGLMNGVEYAILVSAQNEHGGVGPPARVLATPGVVPTTPRDVMAVALDTAIGLTWEEAPALDGDPVLTAYKLSWQLADGSGSSSEVTVPAEPTAAVITGLTNDVRYEVSLLASNTVGEGPSIEVFSTPTAVFPELDIDIERFALGAVSTAGRVIVPGNLASGGAIINPSALLGEELPASGLRVCIVSEGESSGVADNCLMQEADTRVVPAFGSKLYGVSGTKWISQRIYVAPVIGFSHGTQRRSSDSGVVNLDLRLSSTAAETFKNTGGSGFEFDLNSMTHILTEAAEVLPVEFTSVASTSIKLTRINGASFGGGAIDFGSDIEGLISAKRLFALGNSEVELLEPKESSPPLIGGVVVDNMARHSTELITFNKRTTITFTAEYAVKIRRYSTETTSLATDRSLSSTATEVVIDIAGSAPTITFDGSTPRGIAGSGSNIFEIVLSSGGESTGISLLGGVPTPLSNADGAEGVRLATRGSVVPGFYAYETNTADQVSNPRITANTLNLPPLPDGRTVDDAARDFGVFDFIVSDFAPGGVATVVLRLIKEAGQREAGWRYHKYQQGFDGGEWSPFVRMGRDKIFSAPAHAPAPCPSAHASREPDEGGDGSYTWHLAHDGIRNKDRCLLLEIEDGSVNDADGRVNAVISDPGTGAGKIFGIGGGGGGMDLWWLMLLLGGMISGTALARRRSASRQKAGTDQPSCRFA